MSNAREGQPEPSLGISRREVISALARWTVPTVLTLSLGARVAQAAISCPPCTKLVAGKCKACTINQQLNCQCEPCLGGPSCSPAAQLSPGALQSRAPGLVPSGVQAPGGAPLGVRVPGARGGVPGAEASPLVPGWRPQPRQGPDFSSPFALPGDSLFGASSRRGLDRRGSPYGMPRSRSPFAGGGLYERLRQEPNRRRP